MAVAIFSVVATVTAWFYIELSRNHAKANLQDQIFEDARFALQRIASEIKSGTVDYDEYYNQNVVIPSYPIASAGLAHYGQNYGRYYSAFWNPGSDEKIGFTCNDGVTRNNRSCTPLRKTLDRSTGENPFTGKYKPTTTPYPSEDAFCGKVSYKLNQGTPVLQSICSSGPLSVDQLYLISADARRKTIIARERIGGTPQNPIYALSILQLTGMDRNQDGIPDTFVCAPEFQCRGGEKFALGILPKESDPACNSGDGTPMPVDLPRLASVDLLEGDDSECDSKAVGFSRDFVPISPFRVNIADIKFFITPREDPHYAFAESDLSETQTQPAVTIVITVAPNPERVSVRAEFAATTLIATVSAGAQEQVPAPILIMN